MDDQKEKIIKIDLVVDKIAFGGAERFFYEAYSYLGDIFHNSLILEVQHKRSLTWAL